MTAVVPHGEVIPARLPTTLPSARAWLYGYVRSDHPGYRSITVVGAPYIVTSGTYRWDDFVAQIQTDVGAACDVGLDTNGLVFGSAAGGGGVVGSLDRLGWLLGFGDGGSVSGDWTSRYVPPAGIPLYGAQWERVSVEREREIANDRTRRQGGYVWGGARVWVWVLTMHRYALDALLTGWCLRGTVSILGAGVSSPMGSSEPGGAFTGSALGLDGSPVWSGPTNQIATVRLIVAGTTT